jgi:cytochrome c-type biogenesis protein CcmF
VIPELGQFALVLTLVIAIAQALLPLVGAYRRNGPLMQVAVSAAYAQFICLLLAMSCLMYAFVHNDFTVKYVANQSNSALPIQYKLSAVWGGHEGSLLLWSFILSGWTASVARFSAGIPPVMRARVIAVMGMISIGFILFMLTTSNPFERLLPDFPLDGGDLNPLLQDPGLIVHPPMLYMGYVGFSVAFAFAIAGLMGGRLDSAWARWSRPWTLVAWSFLTVGIMLGSWWAYYELGWGGWWFWDPVENASFMPWLVGTALLHSLAVTEKRGVFKAWTVLLAITAFSLSLLGTFLVRSGVLTSVHAFASDPKRGIFILAFLGTVIGCSLLLFAVRAASLRSESRYQLLSREVALMMNNLLLVVAASAVLLGTLYPIVTVVLNLGTISVGQAYFNRIFVPLALTLLVFIGLGPALHWKTNKLGVLLQPLWKYVALSVLAGVVLPLLLVGDVRVSVAIAVAAVIWVLLATLRDIYDKTKHAKSNRVSAFLRMTNGYKGMVLAHLGIAVSVFGIAFTTQYSVERDVALAKDESVFIGGYRFQFVRIEESAGPNYNATSAELDVYRGKDFITKLQPEKRFYPVQRSMMTEAAINPGLTRDLYAAVGEQVGEQTWSFRIYYKPFVRWIWAGALLMAAGGVCALSDKRYRLRRARAAVMPVAGVSA